MIMKNCKIDYTTNTIIVTKKFLEEASQFGTEAQKQMEALRGLHMPIEVRKPHRKAETRWKYERMLDYISCVENSEDYLADFCAVRKAQGYMKTWEWFKATFPNYNKVAEMVNHQIVVTPAGHNKEAIKMAA